MIKIFILFPIILLLLAIGLIIAKALRGLRGSGKINGNKTPYLDKDGNHVYYDRSLIEKRIFLSRNPDVNNLRTFRRLFFRKHSDDEKEN